MADIKLSDLTGQQVVQPRLQIDSASNTNVADADNTSAFSSLETGSNFPSSTWTATRKKRIRFPDDNQPGDEFVLMIDSFGQNNFVPLVGQGLVNGLSLASFTDGVSGIGGLFTLSGNTTDIDVNIGRYRSGSNNWDATSGVAKWKVERRRLVYGAYNAGMANLVTPGLAPRGVFNGDAGVIELQQRITNPANPTASNLVKVYTKGTLYILMFNDGGTVRYKYLDMAGTGVTWVHTTTAP